MAEFFYMGGYAWYVWPSFGLTFIVLIGNIVWARVRKQKILDELKRLALANGDL